MCPDLETFFHKMLFSIFFLENASQIGLRIPEVIDSLPYQKQRSQKSASGNERPLTQGGAGAARSCVPFGWAAPKHPWGAAPRGPRLPGGGPHFSREMGRKRAGGKPPGPPVLIAARSHSLVFGLVVSDPFEGLFPPVC